MSRYGYYVMPSAVPRDSHAAWWGHGGAELMDEIDPGCQSEVGATIGPVEPEVMADWIDRAAAIPGWPRAGLSDPSCPVVVSERLVSGR